MVRLRRRHVDRYLAHVRRHKLPAVLVRRTLSAARHILYTQAAQLRVLDIVLELYRILAAVHRRRRLQSYGRVAADYTHRSLYLFCFHVVVTADNHYYGYHANLQRR